MSPVSRLASGISLLALIGAGALLFWLNHARVQRVNYVTGLAQPAGQVADGDATRPAEQTRAVRELIVPERAEASFGLIAQTQQMLATGQWRIRQVDYDNAPFGREVRSTSPARWWLALIAWTEHTITGLPLHLSVERAALHANPVLQALALAGFAALVAWQFGVIPAALCSIGLVTLFPLAAGFLPGVPDPDGLSWICGMSGLIVFLAALLPGNGGPRWFALAGVLGGLGVWLDVSTQMSLLAGVASGGMLSVYLGRNSQDDPTGGLSAGVWRIWSLAGAATILVAYLLEYSPAHLGAWQLDVIHPLYGLVWIAAGELLAWTTVWSRQPGPAGKLRDGTTLALAAAFAATPVGLSWSGTRMFLARDLVALRLTNQPDGIVAANLWNWLVRDGLNASVAATLLPALAILPAVWLLGRAGKKSMFRPSLAIALMPVLVSLGIACGQLHWWCMLDGTLLVLAIALTSERLTSLSGAKRWLGPSCLALGAFCGITRLLPPGPIDTTMKLTSAEAQELIERDLAHWLAKHANEPRPVVFAPPRETLTLCFYGDLRGIGTFAAENHTGFGATLMIAGAQTMEEVEAQVRARHISYVVIPSWDPFFDEFGRLYLNQAYSNRKSLLVSELRRWNLPAWLRPVAYPMPVISGFERQSVLVYEVVEPQNPATAASRLVEYLVEAGELDQAASTGATLRRYPGDLGALAARAQLLDAQGDPTGFAQAVDLLVARVTDGGDRFLPWDRRVNLAVVLALGNRLDPARSQVRRCLAELNERNLRSLSLNSLYRLLVLSHEFGLEIADTKLRALALDLLPVDLRSNL